MKKHIKLPREQMAHVLPTSAAPLSQKQLLLPSSDVASALQFKHAHALICDDITLYFCVKTYYVTRSDTLNAIYSYFLLYKDTALLYKDTAVQPKMCIPQRLKASTFPPRRRCIRCFLVPISRSPGGTASRGRHWAPCSRRCKHIVCRAGSQPPSDCQRCS